MNDGVPTFIALERSPAGLGEDLRAGSTHASGMLFVVQPRVVESDAASSWMHLGLDSLKSQLKEETEGQGKR